MNQEEMEKSTEAIDEVTEQAKEEGTVVADYIEGLLDIANLAGDIEIAITNRRVKVSIVAEDAITRQAIMPLAKPEVILALQDLCKMMVQNKLGRRSNLVLDIAGYRAQKEKSIEKLTDEKIELVRQTQSPVELSPMNSYERMLVHNKVHEGGLYSHSVGKGVERRVIITPQPVDE
jgi:spoIIIJ-associated protein